MVKRYYGESGYWLLDRACIDGIFVHFDDYAALEASMTGIISGVQLELDDERKLRLAAEARLAELEKDAARYRWLRGNVIEAVIKLGSERISLHDFDEGSVFDAYIDAAQLFNK